MPCNDLYEIMRISRYDRKIPHIDVTQHDCSRNLKMITVAYYESESFIGCRCHVVIVIIKFQAFI